MLEYRQQIPGQFRLVVVAVASEEDRHFTPRALRGLRMHRERCVSLQTLARAVAVKFRNHRIGMNAEGFVHEFAGHTVVVQRVHGLHHDRDAGELAELVRR